jgi:predicted N-acetyltransferase YhbS
VELRAVQELVARVWTPAARFHVGDLAWQRWSVPAGSVHTRQWSVGGAVVAAAWLEAPGRLELLVDRAEAVPAVLDWSEAAGGGVVALMSGDAAVAAVLRRRGYAPDPDGPYFVRLTHDLRDLPPVTLRAGFSIMPVAPGQAARRAAVHRAGWADFASTLPAESYAALMRTYPYRPALDLVVAAPDGTWVASALGWYDEVNRVGLVEPVSCAPSHRRRGLGRAVNAALLHAFAAHGATSAVILPRGDATYPAPRALYQSLDYRPNGARTVDYRRAAR